MSAIIGGTGVLVMGIVYTPPVVERLSGYCWS
jgi:hypothetical protein